MDRVVEFHAPDRRGAEIRFILTRVDPGVFVMGSSPDEPGWIPAEGPRTQVTLTRPFWLGRTQVTQGLWAAAMGPGTNPSHFQGESLPVECVTWDEAMALCTRLTLLCAEQIPSGARFTLPTEAQWEFACRAGTDGAYAGSVDEMAWYRENSGCTPIFEGKTDRILGYQDDGSTQAVATKTPNGWGFYDMHGNVWEWCRDYKTPILSGESVYDPQGPPAGVERIRRGGSWKGAASDARSASRRWSQPAARGRGLGFRLALSCGGSGEEGTP